MYVRQGRALVNHTYTFSEEYRRFGPVHLLVLFVIEDARARGLADVHSFGRGDEEYKHRWTSCSTTCERLLVARRTLAGRAIFRWESDVKPMVWRHPWLGGSLRELRRRWMLRRAAPPTQEADTDA